MVGENFEIYFSQIAKTLEKILKFICLKWLKMHLYCPPWLEKILTFTYLKWLKMI